MPYIASQLCDKGNDSLFPRDDSLWGNEPGCPALAFGKVLIWPKPNDEGYNYPPRIPVDSEGVVCVLA